MGGNREGRFSSAMVPNFTQSGAGPAGPTILCRGHRTFDGVARRRASERETVRRAVRWGRSILFEK